MSSFEFKFQNASKPRATVFAKRKVSATPSSAPEKINSNKPKPTSSPVQDKPASNKADSDKSDNVNRKSAIFSNDSTKFIKRKHKKDKLAAKNLQQTNDEDSVPQSASKPPSATHSLFSTRKKDIYINTNVRGKSLVEKVFSAGKKFSDLDIHKYIVSNLEKNEFTTLTNVQEKAIPLILQGKNVLIRSQTGSGKTLTYAVPIINALQSINPRLQRSQGTQVIIVVPTRELALQTHDLFNKINTFQWIVVGHLCGGENRKTEKDRLRKGVHILIGTPGRLLDHILHTAAFKTDHVRCLVLDEADRLLDMGFKKDIVKIVEVVEQSKVNAEYDPMKMLRREAPQDSKTTKQEENASDDKRHQIILLSATLNKGIAELADFAMKHHEYVDTLEDFADSKADLMVIPNTVKQEFIVTYVKHRLFTLSAILLAKAKRGKVFVFMATSQMVDYHYELFTKYLARMPINRGKLKSGEVLLLDDQDFEDSDDEEVVLDTEFFKLHGSMDQNVRKEVFTAFKATKRGILLCTDVAARGVDVPEADCIIQYTGPTSDEDYLHRVGRTGRAGKSGSSIIFLTHEEQEFITRLQEYKVFLKETDSEPYLNQLCDLMEEPDREKAATALQRRYESAVAKDKQLHKMACFAYSSWSRFYNTYPSKLRTIFNFKNLNLGHYVTSFALRDTPSNVARLVRGEVSSIQPKRLNKKLASHREEDAPPKEPPKRKIKSISLSTSEFASGLEPSKKKKKKN